MSTPITDRVTRPLPDRPVQQIKPAEDKRAQAVAAQNQPSRAAQDHRETTSRQADKGRHVDRYA